MLVPLYEAVYRRLDVGAGTSVLGLGCRSGLALLLAAGRGADVVGLEPEAELRSLARSRRLRVLETVYGELSGPPPAGRPAGDASGDGESESRHAGSPGTGRPRAGRAGHGGAGAGDTSVAGALPRVSGPHGVVTAFEHLYCAADPARLVRDAAALTARGGHVVLATWGPPERCRSAGVLAVARRLAGGAGVDPFALSAPGELEALALAAGLRLDGGGRVSCPFAYPDPDSAVRGLLSTGLFDAAAACAGDALTEKELREALYPYQRPDGTVRMANVFRYLLAEAVR